MDELAMNLPDEDGCLNDLMRRMFADENLLELEEEMLLPEYFCETS